MDKTPNTPANPEDPAAIIAHADLLYPAVETYVEAAYYYKTATTDGRTKSIQRAKKQLREAGELIAQLTGPPYFVITADLDDISDSQIAHVTRWLTKQLLGRETAYRDRDVIAAYRDSLAHGVDATVTLPPPEDPANPANPPTQAPPIKSVRLDHAEKLATAAHNYLAAVEALDDHNRTDKTQRVEWHRRNSAARRALKDLHDIIASEPAHADHVHLAPGTPTKAERNLMLERMGFTPPFDDVTVVHMSPHGITVQRRTETANRTISTDETARWPATDRPGRR